MGWIPLAPWQGTGPGQETRQATLIIGVLYLMFSETSADIFFNALAVHFVSEVDELLYASLVSKATRTRMEKYRIESLFGIEDGNTWVTKRQWMTRCYNDWIWAVPVIWMAAAAFIVWIGQLVGGESGSSSPSNSSASALNSTRPQCFMFWIDPEREFGSS